MAHKRFTFFPKTFFEACRPQRVIFGGQLPGNEIGNSLTRLWGEHHPRPIAAIDIKPGNFRDRPDQRLVIGGIHIETGGRVHIGLSNSLFDIFKERCQALDLVQGDGRELPIGMHFSEGGLTGSSESTQPIITPPGSGRQ